LNRGKTRRAASIPHHGRASTRILDRLSAFEASLDPVVDIPLAGNIVGRNAVMRQMNNRILPAATS
jgi:hypothetical protein